MDETPKGISRRRVIAGTAWLTPAIVLAVAVPRAAASEANPQTVVNANVVVIYNFTVADGTSGRIDANTTFGTNWISGYPPNLGPITFTYFVTVTGTTNFTSPTFTAVATGNPANPPNQEIVLTDVEPGTYQAVLTVSASAYDPTTDTEYEGTAVTSPSNPATFTVT